MRCHCLLKSVNRTAHPQVPAPNSQGLTPVEIVSYSDCDWAGCQKSRRSTNGSLITVFSVNIASTSWTQASVSHSSAEVIQPWPKTQVCLKFTNTVQALRRSRQSSLSRKMSAIVPVPFFRKYINKSVVNVKEILSILSKVSFVCLVSVLFRISKEILTQRFREASVRNRHAFTPPPRQGSENSESIDSGDSSISSQDHLFPSARQEVDQQVKACSKTYCQSHSGEDSVHSECEH